MRSHLSECRDALSPVMQSYFSAGVTLVRNRLILFVYFGGRCELPIRFFRTGQDR